MNRVCMDCEKEIPDIANPYAEVVGLEQDRKQGGTNQLTDRRRTGRWCCPTCADLRRIKRKKNQIPRGQSSFDVGSDPDPDKPSGGGMWRS